MNKLFLKNKDALVKQIQQTCLQNKAFLTSVSPWGKDAIEKYETFAVQGKLLRGALVCFGAEMYGQTRNQDVLRVAAAIELVHSALLVHDDILDNDDLRRKQLSIHKQYEKQLTKNKHADNLGKSLAICMGDVGFVLAFQLLSQVQYVRKDLLTSTFSSEISLVIIAEMQDVVAYNNHEVTTETVLSLYKYKTGRYSIGLPLSLGAILANQSKTVMNQLEKLGETMGVLFQLQDDFLGLYGDSEQTGKSVWSDIKEDKQTLYKLLLLQRATNTEQKRLRNIFGNPSLTNKDVNYVQELIEDLQVKSDIAKLSAKYALKATQVIEKLSVDALYKKALFDLLSFIQTRTK